MCVCFVSEKECICVHSDDLCCYVRRGEIWSSVNTVHSTESSINIPEGLMLQTVFFSCSSLCVNTQYVKCIKEEKLNCKLHSGSFGITGFEQIGKNGSGKEKLKKISSSCKILVQDWNKVHGAWSKIKHHGGQRECFCWVFLN